MTILDDDPRARFLQPLDVSATFENCFFHCYSAHLWVNNLPFPGDLFTFSSLLGDASWASQLQRLVPNLDALNLFEDYETLVQARALDPNYVFEKTIILGILFREWFATKLLRSADHCAGILTNSPNVYDLFRHYKEVRTPDDVPKATLLEQSFIYQSSEAFLDYLVERQFSQDVPNGPNERYFTAANGAEKEAIAAYWKDKGYALYCRLLATPEVKLAPNDVILMLQRLRQPTTIYNNDGSIFLSIPGASVPPFELKLDAPSGHYCLLTTAHTRTWLNAYNRSYTQYKKDRKAILNAPETAKSNMANHQTSLLVAATCPTGHVPWVPFNKLCEKIVQIQRVIKANTVVINDQNWLPPKVPLNTAKINFEKQLMILKNKIDEFHNRKEINAHETATTLYNALTHASNEYFKDKPTHASYKIFKKTCINNINDARPELEKYRGMKQILATIALAIALLGIGYLLAMAITGKLTFFSTDSAKKINKIEDCVLKATPGA